MRAGLIAAGIVAAGLIAATLGGVERDPAPVPATSSIRVVRGAAPAATPAPARAVAAPVPVAPAPTPVASEPAPVNEGEMPTGGDQDFIAAHPGAAIP